MIPMKQTMSITPTTYLKFQQTSSSSSSTSLLSPKPHSPETTPATSHRPFPQTRLADRGQTGRRQQEAEVPDRRVRLPVHPARRRRDRQVPQVPEGRGAGRGGAQAEAVRGAAESSGGGGGGRGRGEGDGAAVRGNRYVPRVSWGMGSFVVLWVARCQMRVKWVFEIKIKIFHNLL